MGRSVSKYVITDMYAKAIQGMPAPAFDDHHVAVYLADFSGPYRRLIEAGLVT